VPGAFAQTTVDVTSAGNFAYDGIYMSPYYATVGGVSNISIVCDDFADETYLNSPFTANVLQFSSLTTSNVGSTIWGLQDGTGALALYDEAAWLVEQLLSQPAGSLSQTEYSYAIWSVFDPGAVQSWLSGDTTVLGAINNLLSLAQANGASGNYSNLAILTPTKNGVVCAPGTCPAQEFFEVVPEGGAAALYLLLAAAACFGAMYLRSPRSNTLTETA
jgi:hypothetical protein